LEGQDVERELDILAGDDRADDEDQEQEEHREVKDGVSDDTTLPQARLLQRVDRRTNLTAGNESVQTSCLMKTMAMKRTLDEARRA
jgi:hypothetical protein